MTAAVMNKANNISFILGGMILIIIGGYIMGSKSMTVGAYGSNEGTKLPLAARISIGLVIALSGLIISYKGLKSSQTN